MRNHTYPVPAYPKAPRREDERDRKRSMKDGSLRRVYPYGPPEPRDMAEGRSEQLGHSPNRATVREHHHDRDHLGNVTRHWVTVRTKHAGLPRNSIWPEGKVAKPGRMG